MGNDDPRLLRARLHGLSPEVKASIDGRLIHDHQVLNWRAVFGRLFLCAIYVSPCPSLAPNGPAAMSELSLLSGVNRTSRLRPPTSDFDPERTWRPAKI